jgi:hypothetical protein
MNPILSEFYGDNTRWFVATVIDASPPYGYEGRVKIRIHGLHTESTRRIPQSDLPWAQCVVPTTEGGASGIGRMPQLQPSALVFGMFMDGMNSQTPIILGSLPHIEYPTPIQIGQSETVLDADNKPEVVWDNVATESAPKDIDIEDEKTSRIGLNIKRNREKTAVSFFLNLGYSVKQSIGLVAALSFVSGMNTGETPDSRGIGAFTKLRYTELQKFSNDYNKFLVQLSFVAFELNGTQSSTNIRLLNSDRLENKGICYVVSKYYLGKPDSASIKEIERNALNLVDRIS